MAYGLEQLSPDIANILGGMPARQAARAASQRQPAPYVDEEEERSLIRELRDKSLTTVGALGNILDLPGSMVRDVGSMIATGKWVNPVDQLMSMTSSENRTSGKDLLQQTGLAGPGESWGKSIGGFGLEMAMDPLTYMTLGATAATKAGQAASKFGLADEAVRVATKKAGAAPGSIGAREARLTTTAQDIAANSTGIVKKRADDFLKTLTPEEAAQPLGGLVGIGLPFMQPKFVFGTGPKSIAAAKGLDAAGRAIRFGKIPGTDVQNPVGAMLGLFDAAAKGAKTPEAAFAAREAFRAAPRNEATVRASVANMAGSLAEVTRDLDSPDAKEIDAYLRSRPWYVEPKNLDERYGLISDAMLEAGELAGNDPTLIDSLPKSLQWITDQMKFENSLLPKKTRLAGGQVTELNDNIDYMARYASIGGKIKSSIGEDASTFDPSFGYRRLDFLRDIPGGTVAFKRGVAMDPVLHDMVEKKVGIDAVETYLLTKHGGWLPDTYTGFYQSGKNKGKAYVKTGRYKAMAKMLYRQDIDVLKRGVFGNSVIFDHLNRQLGSVRQTSTLDNISDLLASKDPTGAARYIKPVKDWEAGGVNIGAQDDTTMPMGQFLKTMGLPAYAIHKDLKKGVDRKGGFLRALAKKMGVDHKDLRHARIDKRIADDLIRIHKAATTRGPGEEILEMTDSVTNLTKGMLTSDWPSFHVRNLTSGWAQNAMLGMWDKQTAGWAGQIMSGNAMKGAARVDWSASEYARRARAAGWDDASITAKLRAAGHSQAKINQFLSQAGKARKSAPPGQGPGPLPPQSPPGPPPQGPLPPGPPIPGLGPQGPIPPGQVSPTTSPLPMADPLVADADALLAKIDAGGAMPAMITGSLRKLAKAVGVDVTNKMKPADVVEAIRQARRNATPGTQVVSADLPSPGSAPEGGFYSKLQQATQQKVGGRVDWQQFQKTMKGAGVKDEEIADIGMEDFFKTGPKTKKEVEQYIEANTPEIEIVEKGYAGEGAIKQTGQTRFEGYSVPGGEPGTYREVLIKLPEKEGAVVGPKGWGTTSGGTADSKNYRGPHWDEPNVIAHLRVDDVVNPDGTKTLRVTEVQSDWHQEGRKRGYKNESPERIREAKEAADNSSRLSGELQLRAQELRSESGFPDSLRDLLKLGQEAKLRYDTIRDADPRYVALAKELQAARQLESQLAIDLAGETPDGPFKKSWSKLAIKQALRMAVEEGYDEVGLVVGRDAAKAVGGPVKELDEAYSIMLKDAKDYTKKYKSYVGETQVPGTAGSSRAPQHSWSVFDENGVANLIEDETGVPVAFISRVEGGRYEAFDQFDESIGTFATQEEARRASQTAVESANEELLGGTGYDGGLHIFKITDEMRREIGEQGQSFYLPNPKAGSLFESASETPVDKTGFTPAQVGFESANMPKPASGDPWNKKSFTDRSAEHAKFGKMLDSMVSRKAIKQTDADLLRVAFFGASEEGMKVMNMPKFGGRTKIEKGNPLGRWTARVNRVTGEIIDPQILIKKEMPEGYSGFGTMLHELGHMGHQVLKRDLGKAWDDKLNEVFKEFRDSGELQKYFDRVHGNGRYLAGTPNENFAQLFADSITRRKVPEGAIAKIISDVRDFIVGFLERLKLTTPLPTELTDRIDEIVDSLLGYDGKKLSDLVPQAKATAPSQVSPVPGVAPTRQVPPVSGVSPVPPVSSVPTPGSAAPVPPVPPAAVVPSPASAPPVGPPTGPPVVPPGPPGPPMGPPPGPPPRRPVRGVDSTFPDPKTGKLPDLDDTLATTMLGQRAYADGVIGSIDSDRAGDLAGSFEVQSGTLRDVLGGIPRPGHKSFSAYRTVAKALGFEPGTTYNPLDRRGVGGRTVTKFGPGAAGEEVGHFAEGLVRLQPYFALIKKGYDPSVAAEKVAAAQVAYSNRNFSEFELRYMRRLLPFYKFCVPEDHEILTRDGWKTVDQLAVGEEVMAFDNETAELRWEPLEMVHRFDHEGDMYRYSHRRKGKVISFEFTDGHRWPAWATKSPMKNGVRKKDGHYKAIKTLGQMTTGDGVPKAGNYYGEDSILSPRHAALLGWIVTDGYYRVRQVGNNTFHEAVIYQSPKKFLDKVIELTGSKPRAPHPETGVVAVNVKIEDLREILKVFTSKDDLPKIVTRLSREAAQAMWQAMMDAEGTVYSTGREMFYQYSWGPVLDAFQILCQMLGRGANMCQQGCTVNRQAFYGHFKTKTEKFEFSGRVWCPQTKSGTWIMRHDGCMIVTGNSRQQIPFQMKQLMEKPGGTQAQLVRGLNQAQSQGELAPDYVRDTASIPVSDQNPILKSIIGAAPAGTDRYLSGLGLMAEDLYSVGPGVRGTGQEFLSRLNPMIKGPLEYFTNQSFFQAGPEGGRPLDEMDPLIGRTIANITGQKDPVKLPQILEVAAANSPISRFLTTARTLTDPRKRSTMSPIPLPGAAAAINLLTGARVTDVSPGSKDAIVRDLLTSRMKGAGARAFERVNFTKEDLAKMSPEERETALQLQGLANVLARRSKERAAERKKAEGN